MPHPDLAPGDFDHCVSQVIEAAKTAGKETGILVRDRNEVTEYQSLGSTWGAVDSDLSILRRSYLQTIEE